MTKEELTNYISSTYGSQLKPLDTGRHDPLFEIEPKDLVSVCRALCDDEKVKFNFLCNISAVDTKEKFEVVYNLASLPNKLRLDLKFSMPYENAEIDSVQEVWSGANWHEREIWELYGINIRNHDNLTRFLLPDDWDQGFPMRKDWDAPDFIRMPEK